MIRPKLTQATREKVAYRSGGRCELAFQGCWGSEDLHVHHRKLRRHGDHTVENLIHACGHCHTLVHEEVGTAHADGVARVRVGRSRLDAVATSRSAVGPDVNVAEIDWSVFFEGAGGFTQGLREAGFTTHGYEYWTPAVETARANGHAVTQIDLSDPANDAKIVPTRRATFSPPCQPFSAAGDGAGEFDERDGFPWTLRIIERFRYDLVIIENVKGLTFAKHRAYFTGILASLRELGYEVDWRVLNCADYGVPQTRERCIIIARRDGLQIVWPMPTHTERSGLFTAPWVTMAEALGWTGELRPHNRGAGMAERYGDRPWVGVDRPCPTVHGNALKDWMLNTRTLRGIVDPDPEAAPTLTIVPARWCWERPSTTIAGDPRVMAPGRHDPEESGSQMADAIRLTIAELACLQGFPADYVWCGTKTAQAKQVGNAVPPILAQRLAEANVLERVS